MILVLYCLAIVLFSLLGGYLPLSRKLTHLPLQVYLSLSAGAMLGAAFFHMLPESAELAPGQFGLWMAMGVIGLYMVERFLSPHSHDTADLDRGGGGDADCHPACGHAHRDARGHVHAAPKIAGWSAVAGLSVHTILGGMALGSAVLAQGAAEGLGLVGPAARASGVPLDTRRNFPYGPYEDFTVSVSGSGDVYSRAYVRWLEIQKSAELVSGWLDALPEGPLAAECGPLRPDAGAVSLVEGWRGQICHVALTGPDGRLRHYKVTDPSFHNWQGLAMALRDGEISDFPLCNKSFNLSYCGRDL